MKELYWNLLTILVLITIFLVLGLVGILFQNPYTGWNPFPPPPLPERLVLPTATATYLQLPPTWTYTPQVIEATPTLLPSSTIGPTATGVILPSATVTETPTPTLTSTTAARIIRTSTKAPTPTETEKPPPPPPPPPPPTNTPEPPTPVAPTMPPA